eukprot:12982949-Alexandrium_andersonii.AAC.1
MSASLVGSEMCIRDRLLCRPEGGVLDAPHSRRGAVRLGHLAEQAQDVPVTPPPNDSFAALFSESKGTA